MGTIQRGCGEVEQSDLHNFCTIYSRARIDLKI